MQRCESPHLSLATLRAWPLWISAIFLCLSTWRATQPLSATAQARNGIERTTAFATLQAAVEAHGTVRVIVQVDTNFSPVGELSSLAAYAQQRQISNAQHAVRRQLDSAHTTLLTAFTTIPYMLLEVNAAGLGELATVEGIRSVAEDQLEIPTLTNSVSNIQGTLAHEAGYTGAGQTIVIIDTGVETTHDAFGHGSRVVAEGCFSTTSSANHTVSVCPDGVSEATTRGSGVDCVAATAGYPNAAAQCTHGTHVASIAMGNDGGRIIGVAPAANLIAIQAASLVTSSDTVGFYTSDVLKALEYVLALHNSGNDAIAAVNLSIGGSTENSSYCDGDARKSIIDNLRSVEIATIVAAGNNGFTNGLSAPACISSAISVGATYDVNDRVVDFSNVGDILDLLAPGLYIDAALPGNALGQKSGTSMAAPHVTGAWALVRQAAPGTSVNDILRALKSTGTPVNDTARQDASAVFSETGSQRLGIPRINVLFAIQALLIVTPTEEATATATPMATPTPSNTPQQTATATPTPTEAPTATATPTATPTSTPTASAQPTTSASATVTATVMFTATPTAFAPTTTPTVTPTLPPTATITAEPTRPTAAAQVVLQPGQAVTVPLALPSGSQLTLQIPDEAVDEPTTLLLDRLDAPVVWPAALHFAGDSFAISAYQQNVFVPHFTFAQPIGLMLVYTDAAVASLDETTLNLYYLNMVTGKWHTDGITLIERAPTANRLVVTLSHLTDFALFAVDNRPIAASKRLYLPIVSRSR